MFFVMFIVLVRQISCDTSTANYNCDGQLCVNGTSLSIGNLREEASNSSAMNGVNSTSNVVYRILKENETRMGTSPLISESEFMSTSECWFNIKKATPNVTKDDYTNFVYFLNEYPEITNRTEVAMLLTHIYRQTNGFYRGPLSCSFKKCVFQNATDTVVNYEGRGYINLYGEDNYRSASYALFGDDTLVKDPDLVATNQTIAWQTAFWFWMKYVHPAATSGYFGATIPMIWGQATCQDPRYKANFEQLFQLYVCVLEKMNINETASRDGCAVLSQIVTAVDNKTEATSGVVVYIVAPISAVIFFVAIILIVLYVRHRRPKNGPRLSLLNPFAMTEKNLEDIGYKSCYEFPMNRLIMKEQLGSGFFGVVMKAKAIGLQTTSGDIATVAVKKVKEQFDTAQQAALLSELKIFLSLGKHLNIINFLGAVTKGDLMLIFEYCEYGNLRDHLLEHREYFVNQLNPESLEYDPSMKVEPVKSPDDQELKTYHLICYSYQISQGMEHLCTRSILHRDLAARNVLLTKGNVVKLCDFGLAKDVYHYGDYCTTSNKQVPVKWMSIEAIRDRVYTTKNDVWAFGVVLWEIFSLGCDPYPGMHIDEQFLSKIINGYRMDRPEYCPLTVYKLMKDCWDIDPKSRPQFEHLTAGLRNILDECTQHYYLQLNENYVNFSSITEFEANKCYSNEKYNHGFEIAEQ